MASHFIPMLSSTPPPLEDCGSFEEDDEFGDFTTAAWTLSDDSPTKKTPPPHQQVAVSNKSTNGQSDASKAMTLTNGSAEFEEDCGKDWKAEFRVAEPSGHSEKNRSEDTTSQDSGHCSNGQCCDNLSVAPAQTSCSPTPKDEDVPVDPVNSSISSETEDNVSDGSVTPKVEDVEDLNLGSYCGKELETVEEDAATADRVSLDGVQDEEDDFADFASVHFRSDDGLDAVPCASGGEEFADFEQAPFDDDPSEQWADFESSSREDGSFETEDASRAQDKILQMLNCAFPKENSDDTESSIVPDRQLLGSGDSVSNRLWCKLEDLDGSVSLQYQWNGSCAFQRLLYALNIDSRNILRNPSVPIFALGLGLLEPVKVLDKDDLGTTDADAAGPNEEVIPPAQFDWSSSGLVNPLDPMQSSSSLLDLDFFVRSSSSSSPGSAPTSSLEAEFLGPDVPSATKETPALLQQLLKHSKSTMLESSCRPAQMSKAAVHILDQLPDLSFMRAKVLMFPVRCTLESS